jgi:hypothetical protein
VIADSDQADHPGQRQEHSREEKTPPTPLLHTETIRLRHGAPKSTPRRIPPLH